MQIRNLNKLKPKKLIVFDFDGTLSTTKSPIDRQMSDLVTQLLTHKKMAVIGGGKYQIFKQLFVSRLTAPKKLLSNLHLFPTTATAYYHYRNGWKNVYELHLSAQDRKLIKKTFAEVLKEINYIPPKKTYGKVLEDRKSQVTYSFLGQDVVAVLGKKGVLLKEQWTHQHKPLKMKITRLLAKKLPHLAVRAAGYTSIDVTKKGIDKAYGLRQIEKHLGIKIKDMLFVGDAIFPGGNDYAITKTPIDYIKITGPEQTKKVIRAVLKK